MTDNKTASRAQGGQPLSRDHRQKTESEFEIEARWRQRLLEGGSAEEFGQAYDQLHAEFLQRQGGEQAIYGDVNPRSSSEDRVRAVMLAAIGSGQRVLEVGSGDGETAYQLARRGNQVTSFDVSKLALEQARSRWCSPELPDLSYAFGDARQLPVDGASYDFVISENMVEHISLEDMHRHLQEVRRVLAPGGSCLIYTPSRLWSGRESVGFHLHVYTLRELCQLLAAYDLQPTWLEPRLLHRTGRLIEVKGPLLWLGWLWEGLLGLVQVHRWPVALKARLLPSIMVRGRLASPRKATPGKARP